MENARVNLKRRHGFSDYLYWNLLMAVPLVTAGVAVVKDSFWWLVVYGMVIAAAVALIYRYYCSHCPHYIESEGTTKCMFFWGLPKFFRPKPGPLTGLDKALTLFAALIVIVAPLNWLFAEPGLLVIYFLSWAALGASVRRHECGRCVYFDCPVNRVPDEIRETARESVAAKP